MKHYLLHMKILEIIKDNCEIEITYNNKKTRIYFSSSLKELRFTEEDQLTSFLKPKEFQLRKILHNKQAETFFVGFELNFVLQEKLFDPSFYDRKKVTVLNNLKNTYLVKKKKYKSKKIVEVYTDGSFLKEKKSGGFAILIRPIAEEPVLHSFRTKKKGSNLIELLAVIKGLELLRSENKLCILTDSQYVIKGITEWIPIWIINNWYTANGTKAKSLNAWKKAYKLVQGKYIEFVWIKAHTNHPENTLCDIRAKQIANYNIK
ncbi:MAG: ribonuclease H [Bacteroidales bacterium]